jgi:hypothetical protein
VTAVIECHAEQVSFHVLDLDDADLGIGMLAAVEETSAVAP